MSFLQLDRSVVIFRVMSQLRKGMISTQNKDNLHQKTLQELAEKDDQSKEDIFKSHLEHLMSSRRWKDSTTVLTVKTLYIYINLVGVYIKVYIYTRIYMQGLIFLYQRIQVVLIPWTTASWNTVAQGIF